MTFSVSSDLTFYFQFNGVPIALHRNIHTKYTVGTQNFQVELILTKNLLTNRETHEKVSNGKIFVVLCHVAIMKTLDTPYTHLHTPTPPTQKKPSSQKLPNTVREDPPKRFQCNLGSYFLRSFFFFHVLIYHFWR